MKTSQKGFTLVELAVVMIIFGCVMAVVSELVGDDSPPSLMTQPQKKVTRKHKTPVEYGWCRDAALRAGDVEKMKSCDAALKAYHHIR